MLDMIFLTGAIPSRFGIAENKKLDIETYFLPARGKNRNAEAPALEMTKWFDTNYHYLVPEWTSNAHFPLGDTKLFNEFKEAKDLGVRTVPKLIGPLTSLFLGKRKGHGFSRLELLPGLLKTYTKIRNEEVRERLKHVAEEDFQRPSPFPERRETQRKALDLPMSPTTTGVRDIHSPRIPSADEITGQLRSAAKVLPPENIWVNPDCGLKTRDWPETTASLKNMVAAAKKMRGAEI